MKYVFSIFAFFFLLGNSQFVKADTWDEPWQKQIIEQSDFFVMGRVISSSPESVKVHVLENLGGSNLEVDIEIDGFFMLNLTSTSGQKHKFNLKNNEYYYLFLKKNEKGNYSLPTPTSGFAHLDNEQYVSSSYRHSYHQSVIPQDIYEFTFKNIWNFYKYKKFDKKQVNDFVNYYLSLEPAGFEDEEIEIFYHQHSAMETAYMLGLTPKFSLLDKFITSNNYHARISAIQLMGNYSSKDAKNQLFDLLTNDFYTDFEKVIAIWSLKRIADPVFIQRMRDLKDILSSKSTGFGGNIMDPRVGTAFPSPKEAVEKL